MAKKRTTYSSEYLIGTLFLIIAALVVGWQLNRSVVVGEITVSGNRMADTADIVAAGEFVPGVPADSIAFLTAIERMESLPWIATAHVSLSQTGRLRIRVTEEEPLALLVDGKQAGLVSESGVQLPLVPGVPVDVPILYGLESDGNRDTLFSDVFLAARDFLITVKRYPGLYAMVSEMMVDEADGVVVLSNEGTVRLTFGHEDFEERIRNWHIFQAQVVAAKGIRQMRSLDFRYRGQVVALEQPRQ